MKLQTLKVHLEHLEEIRLLIDGNAVPQHFHITQAGIVEKNFIDCGGTLRSDRKAIFQVWVADDLNHRLTPQKLLGIIKTAEQHFALDDDLEVEVEYQTDTIGHYGLGFEDDDFVLLPQHTDCLAQIQCGPPRSHQELFVLPLDSDQSCASGPANSCC